MAKEKTDRRIAGFFGSGEIVDPVLTDFLVEFHEALLDAIDASVVSARDAHFDAIWNACSISRSIRLHLGVLANAEKSDSDVVVALYQAAQAIEDRATWYDYDKERQQLYAACRENIGSRFELLRDGTVKMIAG